MSSERDPALSAASARAREADPRMRRTTTSLMSEVLRHLSNLVRGEFDLARAELQENATKAAAGAGMLVGAIVVALVALNLLAAALAAALTEAGIPAGWSALIVGVVLAIIAGILAAVGASRLKATSLAPSRTIRNVRRDAEAVKEAT